jgi:hypothetical protein
MLTSGELDRVRAELGYNVLSVGAEPYIGVAAIFAQVIQPYLREGLDTTSSTPVQASDDGTAVVLTLASVTGVTLRTRLVVDVDESMEVATVRALAGSTVTVILKKAHTLSYPVTVDAGLQIVRECLSGIYRANELISELEGEGAIKQADEVQFYDSRGKSRLQLLEAQAEYWRNKLASALNLPRNPLSGGGCGGSNTSLY